MTASVVIPVYNEEKVISACLESLNKQTLPDFEVIVVDDGSSDGTLNEIKVTSSEIKEREVRLLKQEHGGPGRARNLGVAHAKGDILVFVDADMEFDKNFLVKLIAPIENKETIGTFSKEEHLLNKDQNIARFWNLNLGRAADKMHPQNYPDQQEVFRAILKSSFNKAGGFDTKVGYTDDWSISRKLGVMAQVAPGAIYYHRNPETLGEVWRQARWFGKNEFLTKNLVRQLFNLIRYNFISGVIQGTIGSVRFSDWNYLPFKIVYDSAVMTSVLLSFLNESKNK